MKKILCIVGALLFLCGLGYGWSRASSSYRMGPDAVTAGGERSTSSSYRAPQQAVGEVAGFVASLSYRHRVGVVQTHPEGPPAEVSGWLSY